MFTCTYCGKRIVNTECPDRTCEWHTGIPKDPLVKEADPELERLLAEEEQIQRNEENIRAAEMRGRMDTLQAVNRLCDLLANEGFSPHAQIAAIKALVHTEIWEA